MISSISVPIQSSNYKIDLQLIGEGSGSKVFEVQDAFENGEEKFQIIEGCTYEYELPQGFCLENSELVKSSKFEESRGRITPNIYVGTLVIPVLNISTRVKVGDLRLEVQSIKTTYREDYRNMLEEITEYCTELVMQHSSPSSQYFEIDFTTDSKTIYQRFAFIKSIIEASEFNEAIHKFITSTVKGWKEDQIVKDLRSVKKYSDNSTIRQLVNSKNRIELPEHSRLRKIVKSIPSKITVSCKLDTVDISENRFIKHALNSFLSLCNEFNKHASENSRLKNESKIISDKLEQILSHSIFKEITAPSTLSLNSPVLQRKEGYREILRSWLMFNLAAKLIWRGGEDVYSGNKKDIAVLYEYWLFFKLVNVMKEIFKIEPLAMSELIAETQDGLGLKLRQGDFLPISGVYESDTRKLRVEFSYNKTYSGETKIKESGSWTRSFRPDYTLSIWPFGIERDQAELQELMVHIHFDAKYKIDHLQSIFGDNDDLQQEKEEQKKGNYRRADLLKMHTYRDAIRRTAGAYILYPGNMSDKKRGFHEIIPGLGAFAIRPNKGNNGIEELKVFLNEVLSHFLNRASQRERIALKVYETYQNEKPPILQELLPETIGANRTIIPDETYVLVGYYRKETWQWIQTNNLYNARAGSNRGSLKRIGQREAGAKYLLLHSDGETITNKLFKIIAEGPRIFSKKMLQDEGYPSEPSSEYYLVYEISVEQDSIFSNKYWDIKKFDKYKSGHGSPLPFAVTLTELMSVIQK